jgi:hypothetical protein
MATTTYLTNPVVSITPPAASVVDFTDQCTSAAIVALFESQDVTAFGDGSRKYVAGLGNPEVTLSLFVSYGASEVEAILFSCVGKQSTITIATKSGAAAADNPIYTLTGAYLESFEPITGSVGEMSTVDVTFTGGVLTRAIAP